MGVGLTAIACAAVAGLAQSAAGLAVLLVPAAVGMALGGPAVTGLLHAEVAGHRQGLAFGAQQAGAPLGALLAGLALPVLAIPLGWRWAFVAASLLALGTALAIPARSGSVRSAEHARGAPRGRGLTSVHALALAAALASAAGAGFISFLVVYANEQGMSESTAGLLLGAVSLAATISRLALGLLFDRRGQEPLRPAATMLALSVVGYLLLIQGDPAVIAVAAVLAAALGWAWPGALNLAVVQRSPEAPAWAVGVMLAGLFTGAVAGPLLVGLLAQNDLFAEAWILCASCALLSAAAIAATRRGESHGRRG